MRFSHSLCSLTISQFQRILTRADSCTSSGRLDAASVSSLSTQSGHWATAAAPLAANASTSSSCGQIQLSHPESVSVTLQIDCRGSYGLTLAAGNDPQEPPVVLAVEPSSPADRLIRTPFASRIFLYGKSSCFLQLHKELLIFP